MQKKQCSSNISIGHRNLYRPRILIVTVGFSIGGAEKVIFDVVKALKTEFEFFVVALRNDGPLRTMLENEGIVNFSLGGKFFFDFRIFFALNSLVRRIRPHIIHSHLFKANWIARIIGHNNKIPQISTIHTVSSYLNPIETLVERYTSSLSAVNVCCSKYVALDNTKRIKRSFNYYIYNGIEVSDIPANTMIDPYRLLTMCRIDLEQKALLELVEAIYILKNNGFRFTLDMYGDGDGIEKLGKKIKRLGLQENIVLKGFVENPLSIMPHYSVFILPSKIEGFPVSILEAISSGLVVVGSNVGGIPEIIEDKGTGFLIDGFSPENIAKALHRVVSSVDELPGVVANARRKLEMSFSSRKAVSSWRNLYKVILKNPSSKRLPDIIPHV